MIVTSITPRVEACERMRGELGSYIRGHVKWL